MFQVGLHSMLTYLMIGMECLYSEILNVGKDKSDTVLFWIIF